MGTATRHDGGTEDERRFLASLTKSAARSHVDSPQPATEQALEDWLRLKTTFPGDLARRDGIYERNMPHRFGLLDKDNRLSDHPEKYLLEQQPARVSESPPDDLLPIPGTHVGTLVRSDRVTPVDHWQDVRHLALDLDLDEKFYSHAVQFNGHFTIVIWPKNYPEDVDELILQMGWEAQADTPLQLKGAAPRGLYANNRIASLRHLLTHNLDITAVPKRNFIRELIHFTTDEREQERLKELIEPGNEQEYYDYTCRPRRTILELLRDFTGVKIPFRRVLDLFPIIRGREFSVCNGGMSLNEVNKNFHLKVEILVALVEYKTIIRKPRQGLCSRYLKHLPLGTRLAVRLKTSSGPNLVPNLAAAKRPLIAIATGTGIAPIRAVIQERDCFDSAGDTLLFFGCRNRTADFHFAHEWSSYPNVKVYPAFSRDSIEPEPETTHSSSTTTAVDDVLDPLTTAIALLHPEGAAAAARPYDARKNYVQHLIRKHAAEVGAFLRNRPIVMICGNAGRMPVSVRAALLDALVASGVCGDGEEAGRWLADPERVTVWQETW
jgi:sulfite reductase alpha subunit-like flavoprotein